jgi:methyl-accepting chemotaxis protein
VQLQDTNSPIRQERNQRIVLRYFIFSLGFGIAMGLLFPVFAVFFVDFKSPVHATVFTLGCIVAGILVGLFGFLIGRLTVLTVVDRIADRLGELCESEGDLSRDLGIRSTDCVGRLAENFDRFQAKLRHMIGNLAVITDKTQQVGFDLAANSTETSTASTQISAHMSMIREQTELLIEEVQNVDNARVNINDSAVVVSKNIDRQSETLTALSAVLEETIEGFKSVSRETDAKTGAIVHSIDRSHRNLEEIVRVAGKIGEIDESVGRIGELVGEINETAERINVLGINASIEASHAGQFGRGFGVVASEIRKLSDLAKQNSSHISERLSAVMDLVAEGVRLSVSTEANLKALLAEMRDNADDIRQVTERLLAFAAKADAMQVAHNDLVKATIDVTDSMVDMRGNSDLIENSMNILLETADRNRLAIEEITLGIHEIAVDVVELNRVSTTNAENVRTLGELTARFKVS